MRFALPEPSVQGRAVFALRLRAGGGEVSAAASWSSVARIPAS